MRSTLICLFILQFGMTCFAQSAAREKAVLIDKVVFHTQWPHYRYGITVGVIGDDEIMHELEQINTDEAIQYELIPVTASNFAVCDVIYITSGADEALQTLIAQSGNHPVMTIGEEVSQQNEGVCLTLHREEGNYRLKLNKQHLADKGLQLSATLLALVN